MEAPLRFSTPQTNLTGAVDNGDNTYTLTFDQTLSGIVLSTFDPNWLIWNQYTNAWEKVEIISHPTGPTVKIQGQNGATGELKMVFLLAPAIMTAPLPFQLAGPILAI